MRTKFFVRSPQAFWQSSAPGVLSTLVTSVVLYSLTRTTLMSPGQDETRIKNKIYIVTVKLTSIIFPRQYKTLFTIMI